MSLFSNPTSSGLDETHIFFGSLAVVAGLFLLISNAQVLQPSLDQAGVSSGVATAIFEAGKPVGLFPRLAAAERRQAAVETETEPPNS